MSASLDFQSYESVELSEFPSRGQQALVRRAYECMVLAGVEALLDRAERHPGYGFMDTKFSLRDGRDFDSADPLRGRATIYGWIQGRALESLAGHRAWVKRTAGLSPERRHGLDARLQTLLTRLVRSLEGLRLRNHGRLSFAMTNDGHPLQIVDCRDVVRCDPQPDAPANFTDLFYAKGLAAAAASLGDHVTLAVARQLFDGVATQIEAGQFTSDQQQLDPGNSGVNPVPGRHTHSPRMIALGATALFSTLTGEDRYRQMGARMIRQVLDHYVNTDGQVPGVAPFSMWEYTDDHGRPYLEKDGVLRSLPGHATEFVGLALKHLRVSGGPDPRLQEALAQTLLVNFQSGWAANGRGIVQCVDLISGWVLNPDMPWWSLPETLRAALECRGFMSNLDWRPWGDMAVKCSNVFLKRYVQPEVYCMAIQTLDEEGHVASAIPAVPDADPCYHTGLSIIDALELFEQPGGQNA